MPLFEKVAPAFYFKVTIREFSLTTDSGASAFVGAAASAAAEGVGKGVNCFFESVEGLGMSMNYTPYVEGGAVNPYYLFEGFESRTLTLKRGMYVDPLNLDMVSTWINNISSGKDLSFEIMITLYNPAREIIRTWHIKKARLAQYNGPALSANDSKDASVSFTFKYNGCV